MSAGRIYTGGSVHPTEWRNESDRNALAPDGTIVPPGGVVSLSGLTVRDYFAGEALRGVLSLVATGMHTGGSPESIADSAFELAEAMLRRRAK